MHTCTTCSGHKKTLLILAEVWYTVTMYVIFELRWWDCCGKNKDS